MEFYAVQLVLFLMIFLRCVTLIALAPVLGHVSVPLQVKAALGMFMSFVLYPAHGGAGIRRWIFICSP